MQYTASALFKTTMLQSIKFDIIADFKFHSIQNSLQVLRKAHI